MDSPAAQPPPGPAALPAKALVASRWTLPRLPLLISVLGLGAAVTTGTLMKRRTDARQQAEAYAIRVEVAALQAEEAEYHGRFENLKWRAAKFRARAQAATAEPMQSWTHEQSRRFDELVAAIDRSTDEEAFMRLSGEIEELCARGEIAAARERVQQLPEVKFPPSAEFRRLQSEHYLAPLAQFSRQNPGYYRAFQHDEPEAAKEDIAALRSELAAAGMDEVTPQTMLGFELLGAVAPDDPLVADWATLASATDFFDKPDAATLSHWRRAQQAVRAQDWQTAVAHMQSIARSKVRTRQPFRAAYGKAILKNTPDRSGTAYPLMQEAALGGDAAARAWISQDDYAKGRFESALRWFEARAGDGETDAVAPMLAIYAMDRKAAPRDEARELATLEKITVTPDAPPLAWMLLARLYENGGGTAKSAAKAFTCYVRAAEKQFEPAWTQVARCCLRGAGTPADPDAACAWAAKAFAAGEREESVPILIELMRREPDCAASAVEELFEHEQVAAPAGFVDIRSAGPSVAELQTLLARYFDQKKQFAQAARFYGKSGSHDPTVVNRFAELTAAHACETCGGTGKLQTSVPCPTCGGKGTVICSACDGRGYILVPGAPPCTICGGTGGVVQDGRAVVCAACGGTGKGKSSVTKQDCTQCSRGRVPCRACKDGRINLTKECPACHGTGSRALADS